VLHWPTPEGLDTFQASKSYTTPRSKVVAPAIALEQAQMQDLHAQEHKFVYQKITKDAILGACRSYRLRITAVRDPASANSVQLAKLDLYTPLDPPSQPQRPISEAVKALQAAVSKAAAFKPDSAMAKAVDTLLLVLANVFQHPGDSKFKTLKLENVKIKAMMLAAPEVGQVLKAAGQSAFTAYLRVMHTKLSCSAL